MAVVLVEDTPLEEVSLVGRAIHQVPHIMADRRALVRVHQDGAWSGLSFSVLVYRL